MELKESPDISYHQGSPPVVSVIIPTYNRKQMLSEAIDSVLSQDYPHIEIIVSDNASADDTPKMMQDYMMRYKNIRYIRRESNIGPEQNGYLAYTEVTGVYVMVLCDDDLLAGSSFFSKAVKAMEENKKIAITRGFTAIMKEEENGNFGYYVGTYYTTPLTNGLDFYLNFYRGEYQQFITFFCLCRKKFIDESKIWETPKASLDQWLWTALPLYGDLYFIPEVVGYYREHLADRDSTNINFALQFTKIYSIINDISKQAIKLYPDKKDQILSYRHPEMEAVKLMSLSLSTLQKHKSSKEILQMVKDSHLKDYPILYREIKKKLNASKKTSILKFGLKCVNRVLRIFKIRITRI